MQSAFVPAVNGGLKWKWEEGEKADYAPQTHALPPGWPTSRVERAKRNMGGWVDDGSQRGKIEGSRFRQEQNEEQR